MRHAVFCASHHRPVTRNKGGGAGLCQIGLILRGLGEVEAGNRRWFVTENRTDERIEIYNIYPHMVHVNLFGQSYLNGVESVFKKYL